jgi:hypothetical protein
MANEITVRVYESGQGTVLGTGTCDRGAAFSIPSGSALAAGAHAIEVTAQDTAAGYAESARVSAGTITLASSANANLVPASDSISVGVRVTGGDAHYYLNAAPTVTAGYAAGPAGAYDASNSASRYVAGPSTYTSFSWGNNYLTPLTQYTASWYVRATSGAPSMTGHTYGAEGNFGNAYPAVTTAWQRVVVTGTSAGDGAFAVYPINAGGEAAVDLEFWGLKIEAGASATGTPAALAPGQP